MGWDWLGGSGGEHITRKEWGEWGEKLVLLFIRSSKGIPYASSSSQSILPCEAANVTTTLGVQSNTALANTCVICTLAWRAQFTNLAYHMSMQRTRYLGGIRRDSEFQ